MTASPPPSGHRILPLATLAVPNKAQLELQISRPFMNGHLTAGRPDPQNIATHGQAAIILDARHGVLHLNTTSTLFMDNQQDDTGANQTHKVVLDSSTLLLQVNKESLLTQLPALAGLPPVSFSTDQGPGVFLFTACDLLEKGSLRNSSEQARKRLLRHMMETLITTLLEALDLEVSVAGRRRHRQKLVREYIEKRLADPTLTPQKIAQAYGISARALYLLFDGEPGAVAGWILNRRLERIHADLINPACSTDAIAVIAYRHGFRNAAHLSRRFRQKFDMSPREARQKAS